MAWTQFRSPALPVMHRWERASAVLEAAVRAAVPAWKGGEGIPDEPASFEAVLSARALLAMGERDATKDLVRAMAVALAGGRVARPVVPALQHLYSDFLAWTGDVDFTSRYPAGLDRLAQLPDPERQTLLMAAPDLAVGWGVVGDVIERLFALGPDALAGRLACRPALPGEWREMALEKLRVGATTLDLLVRRTPSALVLRASRLHGPRLRLEVEPPAGASVTGVMVDEVPLGAPRAAFELAGEHEVQFLLA